MAEPELGHWPVFLFPLPELELRAQEEEFANFFFASFGNLRDGCLPNLYISKGPSKQGL